MELRKLCCHPYMLEGVEPDIEDTNESYRYDARVRIQSINSDD